MLLHHESVCLISAVMNLYVFHLRNFKSVDTERHIPTVDKWCNIYDFAVA